MPFAQREGLALAPAPAVPAPTKYDEKTVEKKWKENSPQIVKDLHDILLTYPIGVRIIGSDYKDVEFSGKDICLTKGIEIYYNKRSHNFSSTELRKRIQQAENENK